MAQTPKTMVAMRATFELVLLAGLAALDDAHVDVVGEGRGPGQREAGHHRQDGGEGHRRDEAQEGLAAQQLGEQRGRHVAARRDLVDHVPAYQDGGAEPDDGDDHVEVADEAGGVEHRLPRRLGVGHGVEAHEDVGQAQEAEHERQAQRHGLERARDEAARHQRGLPVLGRDRAVEVGRAPAKLRQHEHGEDRHADEEQHRLDDLDPGGGEHPAEEDVGEHHRAHDDLGPLVGDPEHQLDELPGADHLRDGVEEHGEDAAHRRGDPDRALLETEGHHVGEGELAQVPERLGHQEHERRPPHQPAGGVDHAVVALQGHHAGDAEERGGRHVVAGQREPVLHRRHASSGGVELGRGLGAPRRPVGHHQRERDDEEEEEDGRRGGGAERALHGDGVS